MKPLLPARTALCLALGGALLLQQPLLPASAAVQQTRHERVHQERVYQRASLRIAPRLYVGGQRITFAGNIGRHGKRAIHLQTHMGRPGDKWTNVAGSGARTNSRGGFRFSHISPSMFGIKIRVKSKRVATPARTLDPKSQEIGLQAVRNGGGFTIKVDTTPTVKRRPDLPTPAFPGRTLTLQQRDGVGWQTLDTATTDKYGKSSFEVSAGQTSPPVYRVRQENYTAHGNRIGWFPSFPLDASVSARQRGSRSARVSGAPDAWLTARPKRPPTTAANTYGWGRSLWDFAWEWGESLSSGPYRGTDKHGSWLDTSDGSGRVSKHNGGLTLESQYNFDGRGDHGSTWATLRGNPATYGRWETKLRMNSSEKNAQDYRVRVELVPDAAPGDRCRTITVADVAAHGSYVTVAANGGDQRWSYRKQIGSLLNGKSATLAAEVTKGHISWFVNGRIIATAKNSAAVSDVPLTMRLSLVGSGQDEMNRTAAIFDWQRGYSLAHGRSPNGKALGATDWPCP